VHKIKHYQQYYRRQRTSLSTSSSLSLLQCCVSLQPVNYLQLGYDHLQMPSQSGAVLPGRHVYSRFIRHWQVASADHSLCHVQGLQSVGKTLLFRAHWEVTPSVSNWGFHLCLSRHLQKKTRKSSLWLLTTLRTLS